MDLGLNKFPYYAYVSDVISNVLFLTWTHLCSVTDCLNLASPPNGRVSTNERVFNSVATFSCEGGYTLVGNGNVVCQEGGTWSDIPECQGTLDLATDFRIVSNDVLL